MPDGPRDLRGEHGGAERGSIAVAGIRVPDGAERRPGQRDPGVELSVSRWNSTPVVGKAVVHLPERRRPAADDPLVVVMERPDAVPRDVEHLAAEDAEPESEQDVELAAPEAARGRRTGSAASSGRRAAGGPRRSGRRRRGRDSRPLRRPKTIGRPTGCCRSARAGAAPATAEGGGCGSTMRPGHRRRAPRSRHRRWRQEPPEHSAASATAPHPSTGCPCAAAGGPRADPDRSCSTPAPSPGDRADRQ